MKNTFTILFLIGCITSGIAQKKEKSSTKYLRYDRSPGTRNLSNYLVIKKKLEDGTYKFMEYYRFGTPLLLRAEYIGFEDDTKNGVYKRFGKDKLIKEEGIFQNGKKEGEWKFYKDGKLDHTTNYIKGKKEGISRYYDNNNKELYTWTYKNGESHGSNTQYRKDGTIKFEGTYENGELQGKSVKYYKDEKPILIAHYKNGKFHGTYSEFYKKSGNTMGQGEYTNGKQIGEWKWYREDGSMASHEFYTEKGKLKKITFYDTTGKTLPSRKKDVITGVIEQKQRLNSLIKEHIKSNYEYPEIMHKQGIEGKVFVRLKIDKEGKITDVKYKSDTHPTLEMYAKKIIESLPEQKPVTAHNMPKSVFFTIPLVFRVLNTFDTNNYLKIIKKNHNATFYGNDK